MRRTTKRFAGLSTIAVCAAAAVALSGTPASAKPNDVVLARQGTVAYHDSSVITGDTENWFQLYDLNNITCIDDPTGGMGIHFVSPSRLNDPTETASQPEAIIYEPQKNGTLRLVAVEYVVTAEAWAEAGNTEPPRLDGQDFEFVEAGNRYGLPDFYEMHAWLWRHNPSGMHNDWNPKVTCQYA